MAKPLALTSGEPAGIGPDIAIGAWLRRNEAKLPPFYLLGDRDFFAGRAFPSLRLVEQSAAEWQHAGPSAVGEEAEVADTGKAPWQHMLYKAAQELFGSECEGTLPAMVGIVLPAETYLSS